MPYASTPTLLDLNYYARIVGFDPLHFSQGFSTVRPEPSCSDVWMQYNWQDPDKVSRDHIKFLIGNAERDVADALGYWPAPTWIEDEKHQYPRPQRREFYGGGADVRGRWKSITTNYGHVRYIGRRATTLLSDDATWVGIDADGDGFTEIAEFQGTVPAGLDVCEIKAYFKEYSAADATNTRTDPSSVGADPAWEIKPVRVSLTGTTCTVWVHSWDLFRPQLKEALNAGSIDADDPTNYVDQIMLYRVYNDPQHGVEFQWGSDVACEGAVCDTITQAGCVRVKDSRGGIVVPQPATYLDGVFTVANWSQCVEPDSVRLWYNAGVTPRVTRNCIELDDYWAKTITILATSRTDWPICTCDNNLGLLTDFWRTEVSKISKEKSFIVTQRELGNPFGTRIGEIIAWRRVSIRGRRKGQTLNV